MSSTQLFPERPMSWEYIAAFLDGEGSIVARKLKGAKAPHVWLKWHQKMDQGWVLVEIMDFLQQRGIRVYYGERETKTGTHGWIEVFRKEDVELVLRRMIPYLRVKRDRAITVFTYLKELREVQVKFGQRYWVHTGYRLDAPGNVKGVK